MAILSSTEHEDYRRCLSFVEAKFQFQRIAERIAGHLNSLADDLSRDCLPSFLSKATHMDPMPTSVPPQVIPALMELYFEQDLSQTDPMNFAHLIALATALFPVSQPFLCYYITYMGPLTSLRL